MTTSSSSLLRLLLLSLLLSSVLGNPYLTMWTTSSTAVTGSSCEYANSAATGSGSTPWLDHYVTPGMYCAVSDDLYENGVGCGKCYTINYNAADSNTQGTTTSGSALIQVVDSGAGGTEHFDCFITAYQAITTTNTGSYDIGPVGSYSQVDCASSGSYVVMMDGNNAFFTKVLFSGGVTGVQAATLRIGSSSFAMSKISGATWSANLNGQTNEAVNYDLTYADGSTLTIDCGSTWPVATSNVCATTATATPGSGSGSSTSAPTACPTAECFSATATAEVLGKGPVPMMDLALGDMIHTGTTKNDNTPLYQPVYAWGHIQPEAVSTFLKIKTNQAQQAPLEISSEHLLFVKGKKNPVRADSIKVGDVLAGQTPARVLEVSKVERTGMYAPLTHKGTLLVNGIKASSYVSIQKTAPQYVELQHGILFLSPHDLAHMFLAPFRMLCAMGGTIAHNVCHSYNQEGMPNYVTYSIRLAHYLDSLQLNIGLQMLLALVVVSLMGALLALENLVGASYAPLVMAGVAGLILVLRFSKVTFQMKKVKTV